MLGFPYRQDQSDVCVLSGWVSPHVAALSRLLRPSFRFFRPLVPPAPSPFLTEELPQKRSARGFPSWRQRSCG